MISNSQLSELEHLRDSNSRLSASLNELQHEISYYQGETRRLEWEKSLLKEDICRVSKLCKSWLSKFNITNSRNLLGEGDFLKSMVTFPCKSISDLLQIQGTTLCVTSCQAPYFIEVSFLFRTFHITLLSCFMISDCDLLSYRTVCE